MAIEEETSSSSIFGHSVIQREGKCKTLEP